MSTLKHSLQRLKQAGPVDPARVAVLLCPPLTRERWAQESRPPGLLARLGKRKEFVRQQLKYFPTWEKYEQKVALPCLQRLLPMEERFGAGVFLDVDFTGFKSKLRQPDYQVFFLVAHHQERKRGGAIEFADGGAPDLTFRGFLMENNTAGSLILFVCRSGDMRDDLLNEEGLEVLGAPYHRIPLVTGIEFLYVWLSQMDGQLNLFEAYQQAIDLFMENNFR